MPEMVLESTVTSWSVFQRAWQRAGNIPGAPRSIPKEWGDLPIDEFYKPKPVTKEDMKLKPLILEA